VFPDREHFGRIFYNQARMSAAGHPADRRGHGLLHRRRRLRAGHGDESIIVREQGTIFLGGPPLVKAATGEVVSAETSAAPTCTAATPASPTTTPQDDAHALALARATSSRA
jgi:3-methylcrotonyl-CoA carboxylase beta subunit